MGRCNAFGEDFGEEPTKVEKGQRPLVYSTFEVQAMEEEYQERIKDLEKKVNKLIKLLSNKKKSKPKRKK